MQLACALDLVELDLDARDALFDDAAIRFDLGLAGAAQEAEPAPLTLEMGPEAHQSALLTREMRKLDLQRSLARARAPSENFKDQSRAVDYFRVPRLLQIALLNRRKRTIHHHDRSGHAFCKPGDFIDLALADVGRGSNFTERHQSGFDDGQVDSARKPNGFLKTGFGRARVRKRAAAASGRRLLEPRLNDNRSTGLDTRCGQTIGTLVATLYFQLRFISGRRLVGAFE